ncbi:thiosulfate:glutathione sulfurtransferase isoform X2 [Latimeria chalumnae]|uniref:Thiosulfate sulfurtransferase like domain containing 1 n=1 Tax=Latimeria chalumnae TaxID=7897 RepID=M3XJ32_LATCH|nr:PREDICTED: thiosulfate sulfurtransferase/rhodanese-like domain-containing protein 1 isoform X2 [Latimeria chalumnae]|eukprot:XP_006009103.1 PREDICTED: thiosulfate sulfurtransferase/rhodanese-like domain-containing protein 1 isoform X2 [Latimeria chalumnae]
MADTAQAIISYEELKQLLGSRNIHLFDVRSPEEVGRGKILDSVNIPVDEVEMALKMDPEAFRKKYKVEKPTQQDTNIVFHCQMGMRGAQALTTAQSLGYSRARHFSGGYKEWSDKEGK